MSTGMRYKSKLVNPEEKQKKQKEAEISIVPGTVDITRAEMSSI